MEKIFTVRNKKDEKFLRRKTLPFRFPAARRRDVQNLLEKMKRAMRAAHGVGLSANQIGIDVKVFVAEVPDGKGNLKFYAVFNPEIQKASSETIVQEEGCLSVPGVYGEVERAEKVTLIGFNKSGKPLKIKAWGLLARVFQHETDHLGGALFIDKAKNLFEAVKREP